MIVETLLVFLVVVVLLFAINRTASLAKHLLVFREVENGEGNKPPGRSHLPHGLTGNPRDIVLTVDLFKSLAYLIIVALVAWLAPLWSISLGWPWVIVFVIAMVAVWILRVIVGEVLPRVAMADISDEATPRGLIWFVGLWWLMRPFISLLRRIGKREKTDSLSAEEREEILERALEALAQSVGGGEMVIEEDEREMIQGVIGLENTEVREVMVPRIHMIAVEENASVDEVRRVTAENGHSRIPVYEGDLDTIIGILYVKDLFTGMDGDEHVNIAQLARDAFVVPETKRVDALLEELKRRKTHIAIVVDEFGGTAGLVTMEDILEEIVGDIRDEHDLGERTIERVDDDTLVIDGVVPLADIGDELDMDLPDEKFETIGGLIYDRVGGVPGVGDTIEEYGLEIKVQQMDGQRIARVRVHRKPQVPESE